MLEQADQVRISGIAATGRHGVLAEEKIHGQEFVIDLTLGIELAEAGRTDDLSRTVDYAQVTEKVVNRVQGSPFQLIEALAEAIAADCLSFDRVQVVEVIVHKPNAPVPHPFSDISVRIVRSRM